MGYYTYYSLDFKKLDANRNEIDSDENIEYAMGASLMKYKNDEIVSVEKAESIFDIVYGGGAQKWYDFEEDMLNVSKEFPDYCFVLEGRGEDADDIWQETFFNGKHSYCQGYIMFEEVDKTIFD